MIVVCPYCSAQQEYKQHDLQSRKRKLCCNIKCHKKFEVKATRTDDYRQKSQAKTVDNFFKTTALTELDQRIIKLIRDDPSISQVGISKETQFHQGTISKKLKKLEELGIIKSTCNYPKMYDIAEDPTALQPEKSDKAFISITTHKFQCRTNIQLLTPELANWKDKEWPMNHRMGWLFNIKDVSVTNNNNKSLSFFIFGAGKDGNEAESNAMEKAVIIKQDIERKCKCLLQMPTFYPDKEKDFAPILTTQEELDNYKKNVYSDKTHPGIETHNKAAADALGQMIPVINEQVIPALNQVGQRLEQLENKVEDQKKVPMDEDRVSELFKQFSDSSAKQFDARVKQLEQANEHLMNHVIQEVAKSIGQIESHVATVLANMASKYNDTKTEIEKPKDAPSNMYG
jgi:DNA-binding Lrp family transcriptional regulator